jgi:hypothetical protein
MDGNLIAHEADTIAAEAETIARDASTALMTPHVDECMVCFVDRQLEQFGCDNTHRFAESFRDQSAPGAAALARRLSALGARCCDCEIFMNAFQPHLRLWEPHPDSDDLDGDDGWAEPLPPQQMPSCAGVSRGSLEPCSNWERMSRWW